LHLPRRVPTSSAALLAYAAISFGYFGWRLLPHPGRELVGLGGESDAEIFVWSFAWWPHAILARTNPFFSHVVYAPTGINLAWVTSVPGLALAFSPVTLLFGPAVSYNLAAVLLPALSAWTAFLFLRYLTGSPWAALVGGYLYGFSSYVLGHELASHLNLTGVFLVPLGALVLLRHARGELASRRLLWQLGLIVAGQISISTEVATTATIALLLALVLALVLLRGARPWLRSALAPVAAAYALAALLTAPLLYYAATGIGQGAVEHLAPLFSADLLNTVLPTRVTAAGGDVLRSVSGRFPGDDAERGSYLGPPALLVVALLALRSPRPAAVPFLLAAFATATFLSLGNALYVAGHRVVSLPWSLPSRVTGLESVLPSRFSLYAALAVATMVAIWIASARGGLLRPYVVPALAVAAIFPPVWSADGVHRPARVAFFSDGISARCFPAGETLLVFPFGRWGESLLWQAESGFRFDLVGGTLAHNDQPSSFAGDPTVARLLFDFLDPAARPSMDELRGLAARRGVDRVVSADQTDAYPSATDMRSFGPVRRVGGVFVAPACGRPSLAGDARPARAAPGPAGRRSIH